MNKITGLTVAMWATAVILPAQNTDAVFSHQVESTVVHLLSEGQGMGKTDVLIDASPDILQRYAPDGRFPNATNAFLICRWGQLTLVDAGMGIKLFDNLQSLGVSPDDIGVVVLTHMHFDHIGGLLRNEAVAFPYATLYLPKQEYDYWMSDEEMHKLPESKQGGFANARKVIAAYHDKLTLFEPAQIDAAEQREIIPGLYAIAAYGHTPGHTAYLVTSGNERLLLWGDVTHAMAVQMPHPEIAVHYDTHPQEAIAARQEIVAYAAKHRLPVAGMHIAYPAMGTVYVDSSTTGRTSYFFQSDIVPERVTRAVTELMNSYPEARLQDIYKSFFQDYFGPGHLIPNVATAEKYLREELTACSEPSGQALEPTGWQTNYYRVNLSVLKENKVSFDTFLQAFVASANDARAIPVSEWEKHWHKIQTIIDTLPLCLPNYEHDKAKIAEMLAAGKYVLHHSEAYNAHYQPHYRIISRNRLPDWSRNTGK